MGRGKIQGRGTGKHAVMFEAPSDEDEGPPGRVAQFCETAEEAKELASRLNAMLRRTSPHWGGKKYGIYYVRAVNCQLPWIKPDTFSTHCDVMAIDKTKARRPPVRPRKPGSEDRPKKNKRYGVCPICKHHRHMASVYRCHPCYLRDRRKRLNEAKAKQ